MLPSQQIGKGQWRPTELLIKPDTEIMQRHFSRQPRLEALQRMGTFPTQTEYMQEGAIHGFNDLPKTSQPTTPILRPRMRAVAFGSTDDYCPIVLLPVLMPCLTLKAFISQVGTLRRRPDTRQCGLRGIAHGEKGFRQRLILGAA